MNRFLLLIFPLLLLPSACRKEASAPKAVPVAGDDALRLTFVSFNIRYENPNETGWRAWPNRIDRVVRTIRTLDPDVFGIQEAQHGQVADLRASLPDYDFHGVGREDGRRSGEYAAIFFRRDRFGKTESGHFWLSDHPETPGSQTWGNSYPRMVSWLRLADRASGRGFYAYNTHLDHRNQHSREKAATLIARRIDARSHPEEPVALMGDFNAGDTNPAVAYLTGQAVNLAGEAAGPWKSPLIDTLRAAPTQERHWQTLHLWRVLRPGWPKIDHILVTSGAVVEAAGIHRAGSPEAEPSDHFPVWARMRWE